MPSKYSTVSRAPSKASSRAPSNALVTQTTALAPSMPRLSHSQGAWVPVGKVAEFSPCHDPYCHDGRYYGGHWRHYEQEKWMSFDEIASLSKRQEFQSSIQSSRPQGYIVEDITDTQSLAAEERKRKNLFQKQIAESPEGNRLLDPNFGGDNDNSPSVSQVGSTMSTGSQAQIAALQEKIRSLSQQNSVVGSTFSSASQRKINELEKQIKTAQASANASVVGSTFSSASQRKINELEKQLKTAQASANTSVVGSTFSSASQRKINELNQQLEMVKTSGNSVAGSNFSSASQRKINELNQQLEMVKASGNSVAGSDISRMSAKSQSTIASLERDLQLLDKSNAKKRKAPPGDLRQQTLLKQQQKRDLNSFELDLDDLGLSEFSLSSPNPNKKQKIKVGNLEGTMEYIGDGKSTISRNSRTSTIVKHENQIG